MCGVMEKFFEFSENGSLEVSKVESTHPIKLLYLVFTAR